MRRALNDNHSDQEWDRFIEGITAAIERVGALPPEILVISLYEFFAPLQELPGAPEVRSLSSRIATDPRCWKGEVEGALRAIKRGVREQERSHHPAIGKIIAMVESDIRQDLSLKRLSYEFSMNATYLGQLFKQETGEYFTHYLNKKRVERSRELLETTYLKSTEISREVGLPDANYFYRLFKQMVGVSPAVYRRQTKRPTR